LLPEYAGEHAVQIIIAVQEAEGSVDRSGTFDFGLLDLRAQALGDHLAILDLDADGSAEPELANGFSGVDELVDGRTLRRRGGSGLAGARRRLGLLARAAPQRAAGWFPAWRADGKRSTAARPSSRRPIGS
jgi:hypothetical protein